MPGLPMVTVVDAVGAAGVVALDLPKARPATAPPAATATRLHLARPLCPAEKTPSPPPLGAIVSLRYWVLMMPARAWSLTAVMRISTGPGVLFHCMPHTVAWPSGPVVTTS